MTLINKKLQKNLCSVSLSHSCAPQLPGPAAPAELCITRPEWQVGSGVEEGENKATPHKHYTTLHNSRAVTSPLQSVCRVRTETKLEDFLWTKPTCKLLFSLCFISWVNFCILCIQKGPNTKSLPSLHHRFYHLYSVLGWCNSSWVLSQGGAGVTPKTQTGSLQSTTYRTPGGPDWFWFLWYLIYLHSKKGWRKQVKQKTPTKQGE